VASRGVAYLRRRATASRFNWRVTLVQWLVNAVVIAVVIVVLPGFTLHARYPALEVLWLAAVFGVVSAVARPVLEFFLLPYVLQSFGLVVVLINAALLALLSLTSGFAVQGVWPLFVGAIVAAVVEFFLEGVLGLTPPVIDDDGALAGRELRAP
jgi:putative membrane protein